MPFNPENPMVVQSDRSVFLETNRPNYEAARDALAQFAELIKSPEHIHTYRITPLSLWNAASAGLTADEIIQSLETYTKYDIPQNIIQDVREYVARYGQLKLIVENDALILVAKDPALAKELAANRALERFFERVIDKERIEVKRGMRGRVKQALIKIGWPVEDLAGYVEGEPIEIRLRDRTLSGKPFQLRQYQRDAADVFWAGGSTRGGSGVLVLPCGAGKTIIGIGVMSRIGQHTLILTTNITALRQWRDELLDKTTLRPEDIGEYSGEVKERERPIVLTTYQILTYRKSREDNFEHLDLFNHGRWGLIIYDEVHLLPAPVFRAVAEIQGKRRLGLTATLVREDGKEDDVFSLIGPKKFDVPWKVLEKQGWIATAECVEIRIPLPEAKRMEYAVADTKSKFRIASENPLKIEVIKELIQRHSADNILIIGQYLEQLHVIANILQKEHGHVPIITGKTPTRERERIYGDFKEGRLKCLIVSKVANFAIDLPDANVAIQVSGTFGSRQEEAQRLGRILRPKAEGKMAHFYSLVSKDTKDQEFAANRQLFLTEQGYRYVIDVRDEQGVRSS
ncbi:MAG: helicase-associated domain-containing protein [Candidatus Sumerlaeia bacterium]|nr:helicase-associated domain-containing protein [Candidatus Sumerlaeia bacterium]